MMVQQVVAQVGEFEGACWMVRTVKGAPAITGGPADNWDQGYAAEYEPDESMPLLLDGQPTSTWAASITTGRPMHAVYEALHHAADEMDWGNDDRDY